MSAQRASQLVEAGLWLRLSGDHEGAKRLFEQALKLDPSNARARQLLDSPPPAQPSAGVAKSPMSDLDWGMATGQAPTPPPVAPPLPMVVRGPVTKPTVPQASHTIRLGEAAAPEIPAAPRFEDPHEEVVITGRDEVPQPSSNTHVYGGSGIPVPPAASTGAAQGGTMVFSGQDVPSTSSAPPSAHGTMVFGGKDVPSTPGAPPSAHGTMVFGGKDVPSSTIGRPSSPGTMVFGGKDVPSTPGAPPSSGTMVFGSGGAEAPPSGGQSSHGTMVFGSGGADAPPSGGQSSHGTMVFGSKDIAGLQPAQPQGAPPSSSTIVFGAGVAGKKDAGSTLLFGAIKDSSPAQGAPAPSSNTIVFGMKAQTTSSGQFTGKSQPTPPPIAPLVPLVPIQQPSPREKPVITEPGVPPFAEPAAPPVPSPPKALWPIGQENRASPSQVLEPASFRPAADPGKSSTGTLEFNFDDMVGPAGPLPSPPVPYDKEIDDTKTAWDKSNPQIDIAKILAGHGGGFDIISAEPPPAPKTRTPAQMREEVSTLLSGAKDLLDLDDHTGAIELINKALEVDPADPSALRLRERSEKTLQTMFESKLGNLDATPRVKLKDDEIIWLNLDHRAGFVLAQIDGSVTFEDLFAVSGMSRLDTGRILAQLVEEGVISKG